VATVDRVVDGDTVLASSSGVSRRVRLIGIDAPESVQPDAPVECFGPEAASALARLLPPGARVRAAYEAGGQVDQFGRQLWDVWLADGRFVQAELVRQGAVEARAYRPHTEHADLLERLEDDARSADAGLHGACS
jgi:micrococcal nuclease